MRKLRLVELVSWIVGLSLVAIWLGYRLHSSLGSRSDLQKFEQTKKAMQEATLPGEAEPETPPPARVVHRPGLAAPTQVDYSLWAEGRIREYEESLHADFGAPQALFRIPKLDLEVAVLEGTSDLVLNRGLGRIEGTAQIGEQGNLGLAGHRDGFFRGLKDVKSGDTMELETLAGTRIYEIDNISIVSPEDVYVLAPSPDSRITLVTCYPFYFVGKAPLRYIVHGREIPATRTGASGDTPLGPG